MKGSVQLIAGCLFGWLVANLIDGMRPVAWAKLAQELTQDFTREIKVIVEDRDWDG